MSELLLFYLYVHPVLFALNSFLDAIEAAASTDVAVLAGKEEVPRCDFFVQIIKSYFLKVA